jgi:hypothetical protein
MTPIVPLLHPLELTLWHPATRYDLALMDQTFAPDCHEFGRSGRRYTRAELLHVDPHPFTATLHNFTATPLSATIAHTTYISELHTTEGTEWANRSSIWDNVTGRWQLRFHQGTPVPGNPHPQQIMAQPPDSRA